ncbi:hypothetical protein L218DRAFT_1055002, partial [Marasmius fiardii PR-910]
GRVCYQKNGRFVTHASVPPDIIASFEPALPSESPSFSPPRASELASMSVNDDSSNPSPGSSATNNASANPLLSAASSAVGMNSDQLLRVLLETIQSQASTLRTQNDTQPSVASPPTMPPFVASPVSQSKSIFDHFPFTEASTLLEIARHELCPMDIRKLDSKLRVKANDTEGGLDAFNARASTNKDYPSLNALIWPLILYF